MMWAMLAAIAFAAAFPFVKEYIEQGRREQRGDALMRDIERERAHRANERRKDDALRLALRVGMPL